MKSKIPETVPESIVAIVSRMKGIGGQPQWQRDNAQRQLMDIRDYINRELKNV